MNTPISVTQLIIVFQTFVTPCLVNRLRQAPMFDTFRAIVYSTLGIITWWLLSRNQAQKRTGHIPQFNGPPGLPLLGNIFQVGKMQWLQYTCEKQVVIVWFHNWKFGLQYGIIPMVCLVGTRVATGLYIHHTTHRACFQIKFRRAVGISYWKCENCCRSHGPFLRHPVVVAS